MESLCSVLVRRCHPDVLVKILHCLHDQDIVHVALLSRDVNVVITSQFLESVPKHLLAGKKLRHMWLSPTYKLRRVESGRGPFWYKHSTELDKALGIVRRKTQFKGSTKISVFDERAPAGSGPARVIACPAGVSKKSISILPYGYIQRFRNDLASYDIYSLPIGHMLKVPKECLTYHLYAGQKVVYVSSSRS